MRIWLAYIILLIVPLSLSAQEPGNPAEPDTLTLRSMPARVPDTTFTKGSRQWTLSADYTTEIPVSLDTAFSLFHRYRITDKISEFNAYTGNYGLPLYQINFFDREWKPDRFLYLYYMPFIHTPAKTIFMNTHVPFTEMKWSNA
ncbi:MAG: putative porin, partial [Bacteroidales bacterium]